jgi:hypothetical protein
VRDDIHNKAPISPAFRAVLKRCLREADRKEWKTILNRAGRALSFEIAKCIPQGRLRDISAASEAPQMFENREISVRPNSRFEADFVTELNRDRAAPVARALETACHSHVERIVRETQAALIAAAPYSRTEIGVGVGAFRNALLESANQVVEAT